MSHRIVYSYGHSWNYTTRELRNHISEVKNALVNFALSHSVNYVQFVAVTKDADSKTSQGCATDHIAVPDAGLHNKPSQLTFFNMLGLLLRFHFWPSVHSVLLIEKK